MQDSLFQTDREGASSQQRMVRPRELEARVECTKTSGLVGVGGVLNAVAHADCIAFLVTLPDACVDAVVTDPPYEIGFMGRQWDKTGIANSVEMWAQILRVLKPGGHLLAFAATRTYHRMTCAIEDAGFEVRDQIQWIYGSGFPKSLDVAKAMDKAAGAEREVVGAGRTMNQKTPASTNAMGARALHAENGDRVPITAPATPEAAQWQGWGTALKPAHEPIVLARKPLAGTVIENVAAHGTGALNIDGCRVASDEPVQSAAGTPGFGSGREDGYQKGTGRIWKPGQAHSLSAMRRMEGCEDLPTGPEMTGGHDGGRWPANVVHDGSEEVMEAFAVAGEKTSGFTDGFRNGAESLFKGLGAGKFASSYGDSGSAARFFYTAKACRSEREAGLEHLPEAKAEGFDAKDGGYNERTWIDRKDGKGRVPVDARRQPRRNNHPTVKPLALMRYLVRLITPPGGVVLDHFAGSGTTLVAAQQEGFRFIGCDADAGHCAIARSRLAHELPFAGGGGAELGDENCGTKSAAQGANELRSASALAERSPDVR